jgi:hypothetical protein
MIGHLHLHKVGLMARVAVSRSARKPQSGVALFAVRCRMTAGKRKRRRRMIEIHRRLHFFPRAREMARGALHRQRSVRRSLPSRKR